MRTFGFYTLLGFPLLRSSHLFFARFLCFPHFSAVKSVVIYIGASYCVLVSCLSSAITTLFIWRIFYLFVLAHTWIDECEESSPASAHPS